MSHATLVKADTGVWEQHSRLSLAGTSNTALNFFLNKQSTVKELVFCLDNDHAGREATVQLARKYAALGYIARNEPPRGKEDLQAFRAQIQAEKSTKNKHLDVSIYQ